MSYSNGKASSAKPKQPPKNFLEALRDLSAETLNEAKVQISQAVTADLPQAFGLPVSGDLKPNESVSLGQLEKKTEDRSSQRLFQLQEQERSRLLQIESENKKQIQVILSEIKTLAKSTGALSVEVEKAAFLAPANPGLYHKSFFEKIISFLKMLRAKVTDSHHWLATVNRRAAQRSFYWSQVGKSGTKYLLSSERYMVTSTG